MKIRVEVDDQLAEPEITIRTPGNVDVDQLVTAIQGVGATATRMTFSQRGKNYQVTLRDVLFFEAADHQVMVHTPSEVFSTRQRLYELEAALPASFRRVSKSAILNCDQVFSLTKSVTGNLVKFQNSHKQLYVSRRFYKGLKEALERKG
ncbi:response regulator [Levilactobacillus paucivorans]|uniref:Response regulator n=1 Tax=Levilactobacillus paucivorans TaxID=616990 RepID=A0A0R2LUA5_9LACO|nr:LytTR family DNA-binding domain-containing protein [Levilactobacillus paucivorans]KRO03515.1 response regulator [Levilactobacillus paucivorans]